MNAADTNIVNYKLLDELENLLHRQVQMVRKGDLRGVEVLSEKAGAIVDEIVKKKSHIQSELGERLECLVKLYRELTLMVASHKDMVEGRLRQIRKGRKTLEAYRGNG